MKMKFQTKVAELASVRALERNSGESHYGKSVGNSGESHDGELFAAFRLVALLALFLPTSCALAADYFVAVDGQDSNSGTSITEPLRTVGRAAHLMQPGDTCWIRKGLYRETIRLTRSGQKNNPITFRRYNEERVILDGSDPVNGPWVKDPSEATELAKRLRPASIPLVKHDRRYEDP
jgi:hypothetical protein